MEPALNLMFEDEETVDAAPRGGSMNRVGVASKADGGTLRGASSGTFRAALSSLTGSARALFSREGRSPRPVVEPAGSADELAILHRQMVDAVEHTCAISEAGVVSAGAALGKIVEEAMSQAAQAGGELGSGDAPIGEDLKSVDINVRNYIGSLSGLVTDVTANVRTALAQCREIVDCTQECSDVVRNGRYLTMMMKVEVSRLDNAQNVAFIADEIHAFSDGLESLLDEVATITSNLTTELHSLQRGCESVARQGSNDSKLFARALLDVDNSARAMEGVVYGRSEAEDSSSLARILRISQDSLSCFQFHDPMAQDLQTVDVLLAECRTAMNARDGSSEVVEPLVYRKRVGDDAAIDPEQASAGELLLF